MPAGPAPTMASLSFVMGSFRGRSAAALDDGVREAGEGLLDGALREGCDGVLRLAGPAVGLFYRAGRGCVLAELRDLGIQRGLRLAAGLDAGEEVRGIRIGLGVGLQVEQRQRNDARAPVGAGGL